MAILHILLISGDNKHIKVYVDSQVTIDNINKITHSKSRRLYKDLSNFSIFKTIHQLIQTRNSHGTETLFVKVKSHEVDDADQWEAATWGQKLNYRADTLADEGLTREVLINEPVHNLAPAVFESAGHRYESGAYPQACKLIDAQVLLQERAQYEKSLASKAKRGETITGKPR